MFKRRKRDITYTEAMEKLEAGKPKARFSTKLFFWLFILLICLAMFMFWLEAGNEPNTVNIIVAISAVCLSLFFGMLVFIRFVRSRSITGGLFLTTCVSTAVFLGASQLVPILVAPAALAFDVAPGEAEGGMLFLIALAQIGLFAIWFGFLLFTIYLYIQPIKRIDKYLGKILEGGEIKKVKIGHARQYKVIEEKIRFLADSRTRYESKCNPPTTLETTENSPQ